MSLPLLCNDKILPFSLFLGQSVGYGYTGDHTVVYKPFFFGGIGYLRALSSWAGTFAGRTVCPAHFHMKTADVGISLTFPRNEPGCRKRCRLPVQPEAPCQTKPRELVFPVLS